MFRVSVHHAATWVVGCFGLVVACGSPPPHLVLIVEDPQHLADDARTVAVGFSLDGMGSSPLGSGGFPVSLTVTGPSTGSRVLWAEARDAAGVVLARGRAPVELARRRTPSFTIALTAPCTETSDCGVGPHCGGGATCSDGLCVAEPRPCLQVAFVSPADGATGVATDATLIVAFNADVAAASLDGRVALERESDGAAVTVTRAPTGLANTFELTPNPALAAATLYRLRVGAGIVPLEATAALPSEVAFESRFETAAGDDVTPPAAVANVVVDRISSDRVELRWTNPTDADFAGVLILRRADAPVTDLPEAGRLYAIESPVGEATVVGWTEGSTWVDGTAGPGPHGYALHAFDEAANYAAGISPPIIIGTNITWCPDETGNFEITAVGGAGQQLQVGDQPGLRFGVAPLHPPTPDPLGISALPDRSTIEVGNVYYVRPVTHNAAATVIAPDQTLVTSPGLLAPTTVTSVALAGGDAGVELRFETHAWTSFEAEIFRVASPTVTAPVAVFGNRATVPIPDVDTYQMRVRPIGASGCSAGPWTFSAAFTWASQILYVAEGGTGSGLSPVTPLGSVVSALAMAQPGADILVAAGTYVGSITLVPEVRLFGGYSGDFSARDPRSFASQLVGSVSQTVVVPSAAAGTPVIIDGFTIVGAGSVVPSSVVAVMAGAGVTLTNNVITGTAVAGVRLYAASNVLIRDNVIDSGDPAAPFVKGVAIGFSGYPDTLEARVESNVIRAQSGIEAEEARAPIIEGNVIWSDYSGIQVMLTNDAVIRGNVVRDAGGSTGAYVIGINAIGSLIEGNDIHLGPTPFGCSGIRAAGGTVVNNLVVVVDCAADTHGVYLAGVGTILSNNTLFVSEAFTSVGIMVVRMLNENPQPLPRITNNLVAGTSLRVGILENRQTTSTPASVHANLFAGITGVVHRRGYSPSYDQPAVVDMEGWLCSQGAPSAGNLAVAATLDEIFADWDGPDDDLLTADDNDWRLRPTFLAATEGGANTGLAVCGGFGTGCPGTSDESCGDVTVDLDGTARTAPYSIGAFERD